MRSLFKLINIVLTIGLIIIAAGVALIAFPGLGNQALIVRSGSMTPTIGVGSIVVTRAIKQQLVSPLITSAPLYNSGDIIAFRSANNSKTIITHRIVGVEAGKDGVFYQTKGDANNSADGWIVNQQNILGKVFLTLPYLGLLLAFAKSGLGFPLLIIFPASIVILMEIINIIKEIRKKKKENFDIRYIRLTQSSIFDRFRIRGLTLSQVKILIPILLLSFAIPFTIAFFSDTETSTGNVFQASNVFPTATPSATLTPTVSPEPGP